MAIRMFAILVLILMSLAALAQGSWKVTNISNQTLPFETFDPTRGSWRAQSAHPNEVP